MDGNEVREWTEARDQEIAEWVERLITEYHPDGNLDHTARLFLAFSSVRHRQVVGHTERVALLARAVSLRMKKDDKAAFFAGILHDVGKLMLPSELFSGREITPDEYALIKQHALDGFRVLIKFHAFTASCAGLHHALYKQGYGLTLDDLGEFIAKLGLDTVKKILDISAIISICDFIDAFTHRKTTIKDGSGALGKTLQELLYVKYPNDLMVVDIALEELERNNL